MTKNPKSDASIDTHATKKGAVKNSPDRKIAQTVRSERFFGIINYATK